MKTKGIEKFLNSNFKHSECMSFLDASFDKYDSILESISWEDESYHKNINGLDIQYSISDDIIVKIKTNNVFTGDISIVISKYRNNIIILDRLHSHAESNDSVTKITELSAYSNGNSIVSFTSYRNFNKKYQEQVSGTKLTFDDHGGVINYQEMGNNTQSINRYDNLLLIK